MKRTRAGALLSAATALVVLIAGLVIGGCRRSDDQRDGAGASADTATTATRFMDGALYGAPSTRGIVIVAGDSGTAAWAPLAGELTKLGYQVAVLPLPRSDDVTSVRAAAQQLMANGAERVVFIGSRDGAAAALAGAAGGAAGVALLNPGEIAPEVAVPPVSFLALASLADGESSATAQRLYRTAREPRSLALYPAHDPAPTVLAGETGDLKNAFLDFLRAAFQPLSA